MEKKSTFAKRLKLAMSLRGVRAYELAKATNLSQSTISCYLDGKRTNPRDNVIYAIAKELNVSGAWLIGFSDDEDIINVPNQTRQKINQLLDTLTDADLKKVLAFMENCL